MHHKNNPVVCPVCKKMPKHRIIGTNHNEIHDFHCCIGASIPSTDEQEAIEYWNALVDFEYLKNKKA